MEWNPMDQALLVILLLAGIAGIVFLEELLSGRNKLD